MIATRDLRFAYPGGAEMAFADVQVPQGGTLLLRGASGVGKSTWLALVAGLLRPAGGMLQVAGEEIAGLSRAGLDAWRGRSIGLLPQKLHLSEALTVRDNLGLAWFAQGRAVDPARIDAVLRALGVHALAARRPSALSVGQAQRVALARSILMRPRVLLADEPTASLDDDAAQAALHLLREAAHESAATLVIATHDARVVRVLADAQVLALRAAEVAS